MEGTDPMGKRKDTETTPETGKSGGYTPPRIDTTGTPVGEGERVPLFYIDGREYTVPAELPARLAVRALILASEVGRGAAIGYLIDNAIPRDVVTELTEGKAADYLTLDQVRDMLGGLAERYFGQAESLAGK